MRPLAVRGDVEQTIALSDGAQTTLESWGERGSGVLCVHGITSSRKAWSRTARALGDRFRVFAYDQRGHGDSASLHGPMSLARSVDDLRDVAATIGEPVALIGHSWGGAVVLLGGLEPFVTRVVAIDPMVRVAPGTWRGDYVEDAERDLTLAWPQREAEIRARLAHWHRDDVEGKLHAVRSMHAASIERLGDDNGVEQGRWDLRPSLRAYPKPLLILAAAPAESTLSADDIAFVRAEAGPQVRLERFDDQGHNLHRTAFDRYIEHTVVFLAGQQ